MKFSKLLRSKKALSPIFAVLILIAIAVIAGIVVYMFTSGTIATMTGGGTAGQEKVAVEAVAVNATTSTFTVWAKSTGGGPVDIDGAILKDSNGIVILVDDTVIQLLPGDGTLTAVAANPLEAALVTGDTYTVTLTSKDGGSFVSASFKAP
jgi:flagellin-like protein